MVFGTSVIRNSEHSKVKKNRGFLWINEKSPFVIEYYREALGRIPATLGVPGAKRVRSEGSLS